MMSSIKLIPNFIKFIFSIRSVMILSLVSVSLLIIAIFGSTKVGGFGTNASISVMGNTVPFTLLSMIFNNVYMILTLAVLIITVQISEFLFFGHFAQSYICKFRDRYPVLVAYFISTFFIALISALLYTSYYIPIIPSLKHYFSALLFSTLYYYMIIIGTTLVINFSVIRKYTILVMIFLFFITPITAKLVIPMISNVGFLNSIMKHLMIGVEKVTSVHVELSNQAENIIRTGLIKDGVLMENVAFMSIYILIIGYQYMRKDFS